MLPFVLDAAAGVFLLAAIAAAAATKSRRHATVTRRTVGWLLVGVPLPLAVALQLMGRLPPSFAQAAFISGLAAFAGGALLILAAEDDDDEWTEADDRPPPWWPDFEGEFRDYELRARSRDELVRR
jgi:hypothetical protein